MGRSIVNRFRNTSKSNRAMMAAAVAAAVVAEAVQLQLRLRYHWLRWDCAGRALTPRHHHHRAVQRLAQGQLQ